LLVNELHESVDAAARHAIEVIEEQINQDISNLSQWLSDKVSQLKPLLSSSREDISKAKQPLDPRGSHSKATRFT
jgi:hypothetical protein